MKVNTLSKIIYLLVFGSLLAIGAIFYNVYQPTNIGEKKIIIPVVDKIKDAKPVADKKNNIKKNTEKNLLDLETIRVNPQGDIVVAGKTLPNSILEVISKGNVIAKTTSDKVGQFVIVSEKPLESGDQILAFKIVSLDRISISNKALAIKIDDKKETVPIVAIIDTDGEAATKLVQAPTISEKKKKLSNLTKKQPNTLKPEISILSLTNDLELDQIILTGYSINGIKVEARISGKEIYTGSIIDNEWSITLPNLLIAGSQILIVNLVNKEGKIIAKDEITIFGEVLKSAGGKTLIVVQKGDALWKIAYQRLGGGQNYTKIVKLNKKKIDNPDLIYPKQLFILP